MKALALIAAGLFLTLSAGAQLPQLFFPVRSGEVTIRRVVNKDDPNSIWYE